MPPPTQHSLSMRRLSAEESRHFRSLPPTNHRLVNSFYKAGISAISGCVSLRKSESGSVIPDHSDHGLSKGQTNPFWLRVRRFCLMHHDASDLGSKIRIPIFLEKHILDFTRDNGGLNCRLDW